MSLMIGKPGLLTTVQDLGRFGFQKYGVIASGAMDGFALRTANLLVGNPQGAAGLEITMLGPEIWFEHTALISVCGGDLTPQLNGQPFPLWRTVLVPKGSVVTFGRMQLGCRAYLAVAGGIDVPLEINSRSTYLRAGIGGYQGRALRSGDVIPVGKSTPLGSQLLGVLVRNEEREAGAVSRWSAASSLRPAYTVSPEVRVIAGEQYKDFTADSRQCFESEVFAVLPESDRMGYRFTGSPLKLEKPAEMISTAVTFGTVQVPPGGNPIVLMADRQTTGGYPVIAQVASVDLPLLAQVNLGGKVRFRLISLEEAQHLHLQREEALQTLEIGLGSLR
ncbi:biotin-dependent carboxyltransferase family protein [Paenibacillus physcomitrellae]|uniref:KipI antagonist n=1 Tax=Paenibacillus physcomitrellae TaxID=1619311 RepID=A0ABQ1FSI8_9BACL|nr:biotin-dependent carboxyltransferase family protein [Paenibacillus physcomitrellae]GGA26561.1 KipI antagonist [Paenibacillus physcomitrellae]